MFKLRFEVTGKNQERIDEIRARLKDFSVPFVNMIAEWAQGNTRRKFARSVGAELTGADQQMAQWAPVSAAYYKQKHGPIVRGNRQLYPDWLMVRTGALKAALGTVGAFAEAVSAMQAVFGTPLDPDAAAAAHGNRDKRPTIFIDRTDRSVIRRELQRYLSIGEGYKRVMWAAAGRKAGLTKEAHKMDIAFAETLGI